MSLSTAQTTRAAAAIVILNVWCEDAALDIGMIAQRSPSGEMYITAPNDDPIMDLLTTLATDADPNGLVEIDIAGNVRSSLAVFGIGVPRALTEPDPPEDAAIDVLNTWLGEDDGILTTDDVATRAPEGELYIADTADDAIFTLLTTLAEDVTPDGTSEIAVDDDVHEALALFGITPPAPLGS